MNLYAINAAISELLERGFYIDEETGELIDEGIENKLAELQMAEQDKLENVALYIKNLDAEADAIRAEEKALAERRRSKEKRVDGLKSYLTDYLTENERDKFETARVKLSFRKSEVVDVDAKLFLPWAEKEDRFLRYKEPEVDKTELKKALKEGAAVPGAVILTRKNLQIK